MEKMSFCRKVRIKKLAASKAVHFNISLILFGKRLYDVNVYFCVRYSLYSLNY